MKGFRPILVLLSALLFTVSDTAVSQARMDDAFRSGIWTGFAFYDDKDGEFSNCAIARMHGETATFIGIDAYGSIHVSLRDSGWTLGTNERYPVVLRVDERSPRSVEGIATGNTITFFIGTDWPFLDDLRTGYTLNITGTRTVQVNLSGTHAALREAMQCAISRSRTADASNPFGTTPPDETSASRFPDGLTTRQAHNLQLILVAAGFEEVRILTRQQRRDVYGDRPLAAWSVWGGVPGVLIEYDFDNETEPRIFTGSILNQLATDCRGQLAIAHDEPVMVDNGILLRSGAACIARDRTDYYDVFATFAPTIVHVILHVSEGSVHEKVSSATLGLVDYFRQ